MIVISTVIVEVAITVGAILLKIYEIDCNPRVEIKIYKLKSI